jgi:hypothetical protein
MTTLNETYVAPEVEIIEVAVEKGFASSLSYTNDVATDEFEVL